MGVKPTTKREEDEAGGFNPDRPEPKEKPAIGPMPTDDSKGKAKHDLRKDMEEVASKARKDR